MAFDVKKFLKDVDINTIKVKDTNITYKEMLYNEMRRFRSILEKYMQDCLDSYKPTYYVRTGNFMNMDNTMKIDDHINISIDGKQLTIGAKLSSYHPSLYQDEDADVFWLLNSGWRVRKDTWFKDIYHFGWYDGYHFLEKAKEEFEKSSRYDVYVYINYPVNMQYYI